MLQYKHYGTIDQLYMYKFLFLIFILRVWIQEKGKTINFKPWRVDKIFLNAKGRGTSMISPVPKESCPYPIVPRAKHFFRILFDSPILFPNVYNATSLTLNYLFMGRRLGITYQVIFPLTPCSLSLALLINIVAYPFM